MAVVAQEINAALLEGLVGEGLTIAQIGARLQRSPASARYWLTKHSIKTSRGRHQRDRNTLPSCLIHGEEATFVPDARGTLRCRNCRSDAVARRRRSIKEILVSEHGGKCVFCDYNFCIAALVFHHLYPETKRFGVGSKGLTRAIEEVRAEAAKCLLCCNRCHSEVEAGLRPIGSVLREVVHTRMRVFGIAIPE